MSNNEMITLPREVVEQALESLLNEGNFRKLLKPLIEKSINTLSAALNHQQAVKNCHQSDQPQNHVPDAGNMVQAGWKLVPVEPTRGMIEAGKDAHYEAEKRIQEPGAWSLGGFAERAVRAAHVFQVMLDAAPKPPTVKECLTVEQPPKLYPLPADLYDSKDWRSGTYSERVEWLHTMYESAKEQIAELERPRPGAAPYLYYDPQNGDTWTQEAINDGCHPPDGTIALYTK